MITGMKTLKYVLLAPIFATLASLASGFQSYQVRLERLTDSQSGTFVVTNLRRPEKIVVRLAGIEVAPTKEAKDFLQKKVEGRTFKLAVTGVRKDGTLEGVLSYWILDQKFFVNSELVRAGFARLDGEPAALPDDAVADFRNAADNANRVTSR